MWESQKRLAFGSFKHCEAFSASRWPPALFPSLLTSFRHTLHLSSGKLSTVSTRPFPSSHLQVKPHSSSRSSRISQTPSLLGSAKETNPAFQEYHGLFHVKRLPRLNSISCPKFDSSSLGFKLQRKRFSIEKLHLPPELGETPSRSTSATEQHSKAAGGKVAMSCSSTSSAGSNLLDF